MPEKYCNQILETEPESADINLDYFLITMRSLRFVQYLTVRDLLRLKLVSSKFNRTINEDTIKLAIKIGNLDAVERKLYWKYHAKYSMEDIYNQ